MLPGGVAVNSVQFGMESCTGAQCAFGVKSFCKNNDSYVAARREFRKKFGIHPNSKVPSAHAIKTWVNKFEKTGSTVKKKGGSVKTVCSPRNIDAVRASFEQVLAGRLCVIPRNWDCQKAMSGVQKPLHSSKMTVWCAVAAFAIIGPYFFEDERGNACTLTSVHYAHMLQDLFILRLQGLPVNKTTYFQQDGATSHTAKIAMSILRPLFPGHLISRYDDIEWPARSPDLSVCDF